MQLLHLYSDLHAVDPKRLMITVSPELHCGQAIILFAKTFWLHDECRGGAMPYFLSFSFASLLIQSVVHEGSYTSRTELGRIPWVSRVIFMSSAIMPMAGQPVYVGVSNTSYPFGPTSTSFSIPISRMFTTGISGSGITDRIFRISSFVCDDITMWRRGMLFAGIAFL